MASESSHDAAARAGQALAYPADLADTDTRLLVLPHPRSGAPAYFACAADGRMYELLTVQPERKVGRSWFLGHSGGGRVISDGSLRVLSAVDPVFVLLGVLLPTADEKRFRPWDDWAEAAVDGHERARHAALQALTGRASTTPMRWPDVAEFLALPSTHAHLPRVCATHAEPASAAEPMYRLDMARVLAMLSEKAAHVATSLDDILELEAQRRVDDAFPSADQLREAKGAVARSWIEAYLPAALAARWHAAASAA